MSKADETLFAPIEHNDEPWRVDCRRLVEHLDSVKREIVRPRGALLLEDLLVRFHLHEQTLFWTVDPGEGMLDFEFTGEIFQTGNGDVILNDSVDGWSVVDFNLYPNPYQNEVYVFADTELARSYAQSLGL